MRTIIYLAFASILAFQSCAQKSAVTNISADSLQSLLKDEHGILLDVRTPEEYAEGHIPGAINIDYRSEHFSEGLDTLNKDLVYQVYCHSGRRSSESSEIMKKKGFKSIYNLEGGILEWQKKGYPVVK
jgi:rhodanese-related sulfurtransferase